MIHCLIYCLTSSFILSFSSQVKIRMPVYMNPRIGDCSSYNSLDCAKSYKHGAIVPDEEPFVRPEVPPEEMEDYIEAQERYDAHIRLMGESLTIFDELYWRRRYYDMKEWITSWSTCVNGKLLVLGKELAACLLTGGIFMGALCILLAALGHVRLKTLGVVIVSFVIGSVFATGSIEIAASAMIGITLILFVFLTKISTGSHVLQVKNRGLKNKLDGRDSVYVFIDFWYMGNRTVWINLSQKVIGIL